MDKIKNYRYVFDKFLNLFFFFFEMKNLFNLFDIFSYIKLFYSNDKNNKVVINEWPIDRFMNN